MSKHSFYFGSYSLYSKHDSCRSIPICGQLIKYCHHHYLSFIITIYHRPSKKLSEILEDLILIGVNLYWMSIECISKGEQQQQHIIHPFIWTTQHLNPPPIHRIKLTPIIFSVYSKFRLNTITSCSRLPREEEKTYIYIY